MASKKTVTIIARIEQKNAPQACYKVRASEPLEIGETTEYPIFFNGRRYAIYTVTLVDCKVQSCDCPASGKCYHREQVQVLEDARYADRRATLIHFLSLSVVNEITAKYAKYMTTAQPVVQTIENRGTLNKQRPGWLQVLPSHQKEAS